MGAMMDWGPALTTDEISAAMENYQLWLRRHVLGQRASIGAQSPSLLIGLALGQVRDIVLGIRIELR